MNVRILRLCGFFGMLTPVVGFTMVFLAISQAPWFSWTMNALSDLGVEGFESVLFNAGLAITGAVMLMFSAGLFELTKDSKVGQAGSAVHLASSVLLILIGVINETITPWHLVVSVAFFTSLGVMLAINSVYLWSTGMRRFAVLAWIAAIVGISVWTFHWQGVAIPEAVSALAAGIWQAILGYWMYTLKEENSPRE